MVLFVIAIILLIAGAVALLAGRGKLSRLLGAGGAGLVGLILLAVATTTVVPTKQVGIPVTFGQPGTPMSNGFHWKAPWTSVVIMDATVQDVDNAGDNPTVVKDADAADVYVHNLVRWSIKEDAADSLYRDYKDFDRLTNSLVQPEIKTAVATVMADYNPLAEDQPTYDNLAATIQSRLQQRVGDRIQIHTVSISLVDFSEATTNRINALNEERGNTRIAEQRRATAEKEAEANRVLAQSIANDPNVVVANCIKQVAAAEAGRFPAGFQCWPGASGSVVVPSR